MLPRKVMGVFVATALAGATVYGMGCSSSPTALGGIPDSGGAHDTATPMRDSALPNIDSSSGDASSGDAALACPPASTTSFTPATYVPAVAHQGVCTPAEIAAFNAACGYGKAATKTTCAAWQTANVTADGGNACGNCILAPMNNGGIWLDPKANGQAFAGYPNYAACIQLTDASNGAKCAAAFNNANACDGVACDQCMNNADYQSCTGAADQGSCKTYATTAQTDCASDFADGGAANTCFPSNASMNQDDDLTYILGLICGDTIGDAGGGG